ncbi:Uma2 family endonuclease [Streptomyces sp. NBC_01716]|uniref:Uma2 family endonuclease n=1 Tax=Streptomyces sp. NBC_01716 TaxID=2975917 RepID=UPI002E3360C0|nr:Uma2 family endonuclease [Streptomyces sp. NBC_01716]
MTTGTFEIDPLTGFRAWQYLLATWRALDVPEGWRAEIDEGRIVLAPPPSRHHQSIAAGVQRRLYEGLSDEWGIYRTLGVHIAPLDKLYVPDLVVMPADAVDPDSNDPIDASEALLTVEITSKGRSARDDRTKKYRAYARALVPLYLLIDRFDTRGPIVTLFTEPSEDGTYKHSEQVPFGKPIALPEPFGTTLGLYASSSPKTRRNASSCGTPSDSPRR